MEIEPLNSSGIFGMKKRKLRDGYSGRPFTYL
jgi:hypothetical protein